MIRQRIQTILGDISRGLLERDEVLGLALLSALAGESIFLLGMPGVGKSMVARRLKGAFAEARSFEYLMSRFSTPDEIFGPVSITKLKEADTYERVTRGYLPESEIVFLDEIWKAGPAIQNSLLTVLNEKTYLNGNREMRLPVRAIIAASNELPAQNEGLEALWDRFIIRYIVDPIKDRRNFERLINGAEDNPIVPRQTSTQSNACQITAEQCEQIARGSASVTIPEDIIEVIWRIRERLAERMDTIHNAEKGQYSIDAGDDDANYYISDRRWHKAAGILRTAAYINDRTMVDYSDMLLLSHMLWNEDSQVDEVRRMICEEIVAKHIKIMLDAHKSAKRHAVTPKGNTQEAVIQRLHSPDGVHYLALCDGCSLKIRIADYERLLKTGDYCFASETPDECLVIRDQGCYAIQVRESGTVIINGYSYPLVTDVDPQMTSNALCTIIDSVESITQSLSAQISANIFVNAAPFMPMIRMVIKDRRR